MPVKEIIVCEKVTWIEVIAPTTEEVEQLSKDYHLHYQLVRDCMEPDHLPKYDEVDDVNFLILRYFSHGFDKKMATIQELSNKIAIFYTKYFIITIHKESIQFLTNIHNKYIRKGKCSSAEEVVTKVLWHALETFDDPAERLSEQVDFFENKIPLRKVSNDQVEALYYIKRQASISHKILMLMAEPINHIRTIPKDDPALQDVKDQHLKILTLYNQVL